MKRPIILSVSILSILAYLQISQIENPTLHYQNNQELTEEQTATDNLELSPEEIEDDYSEYDWKISKNETSFMMTMKTPFAREKNDTTENFIVAISKQKGKTFSPKVEFIVPSSIEINDGIDLQFAQFTTTEDKDTMIADSDGPVHLDLKSNPDKTISAILPEGKTKSSSGNDYDFIKKCSAYNQLMIVFRYKDGEQKSIMLQMISFTENYRKIE
jgi:hypothetical protein